MKKKKMKIKYKNILLIGIIIIMLVMIPKVFSKKANNEINFDDIKNTYIGKKIGELTEYTNKNNSHLIK